MAKDTAKIKFTAETGEFNDQIKAAESSLKELRSELKLNASQMKKTGDNTKTLQDRQKILAKELETSRSKTEALSQKVEKAKEIYGENSQEVKKYQTQLNNAKAVEEKIQAEIKETTEQLKKQKTAFDEVADKAEKASEKLTNAGKKMSIVSGGIAAVGTASIAAFNAVDEGADNAIKATGATGEAAAEMEEAYKNVAGSIVGDFGTIGSTLGEVNTRFGFTGEKLEGATTDFMKFSEVTGMDATEAVKAVSRAIESAGLKSSEYGNVLDSLTAVGQATGVSVDTLATSLTDYGASMRGMGYDTNDTIAMLAQFEKSGVDSASVIRGMRTAQAKWTKEGKNSKEEFARLVKGIENGSVSAADAYEAFGSKAGGELVDAIKTGRFSYEEMVAVVEGSKGTLDKTFDATVDGGYELELAMQEAKVALSEVGSTLSTSLTPIIKDVTDGLKDFAKWWRDLSEGQQKTILTIAGVIAAIGPLLLIFGQVAGAISKISKAMKIAKTAFVAVKGAVVAFGTATSISIGWIIAIIAAVIVVIVLLVKNWDKVKEAGKKAWEGIKKAWASAAEWFKGVWNGIKNAFANVKQWFSDKFKAAKEGVQNAWASVKSWFSNVWSGVKNVFSNVGGWFRDKFNAAKQGVTNVWSGITGFFSGIYSKIKNTFARVKDAVLSPFKTAIDKVKGIFNSLKLKFPKIKMPHFRVSPKGWKIGDLLKGSIPKLGIDWYAEGGIMTKPTIFGMNGNRLMAGGEAGHEAILPIDKLRGYIAEAINRNVQTANIQGLAESIEDLANRPVILNLNGREFARATAGDTDSVNGLRSTFKSRGLEI